MTLKFCAAQLWCYPQDMRYAVVASIAMHTTAWAPGECLCRLPSRCGHWRHRWAAILTAHFAPSELNLQDRKRAMELRPSASVAASSAARASPGRVLPSTGSASSIGPPLPPPLGSGDDSADRAECMAFGTSLDVASMSGTVSLTVPPELAQVSAPYLQVGAG